MAKVIIGKEEYTVPELNFVAIEKAWDDIEQAILSIHPMKGPSAAIRVIAAGIVYDESFKDVKGKFPLPEDQVLDEDQTFEWVNQYLKRQLKGSQISNVRDCLTELTKEAGITKEGEDQLVLPEGMIQGNPLMETVLASSQNSSPPDVKEEVGKESEEGGT